MARALAVWLVIAVVWPIWAMPAGAQKSEDTLHAVAFDAPILARILREQGFGNVERKDDNKVRFTAEGWNYLLILDREGDLQLYFGLKTKAADLAVVNLWNRERRFSRAYIDTAGDAVLEADFLGAGALTERQFIAFVKLFVSAAADYRARLRQAR